MKFTIRAKFAIFGFANLFEKMELINLFKLKLEPLDSL